MLTLLRLPFLVLCRRAASLLLMVEQRGSDQSGDAERADDVGADGRPILAAEVGQSVLEVIDLLVEALNLLGAGRIRPVVKPKPASRYG